MNKNHISLALFVASLSIVLGSIVFLGEYDHRMSIIFVGIVCGVAGMILRLSDLLNK